MKSKTPLMLMEQLIMILIFALAAAWCMRLFVHAAKLAEQNEAVFQASFLAQNTAEEIKSRGGAFDELFFSEEWKQEHGVWIRAYDADWTPISESEHEGALYRLEVREEETELSGLVKVRVSVWNEEQELFAIPVAWQEVSSSE